MYRYQYIAFYTIYQREGFVCYDALSNPFMDSIMTQLSDFDYESKILGNSEITYTMWYNLF